MGENIHPSLLYELDTFYGKNPRISKVNLSEADIKDTLLPNKESLKILIVTSFRYPITGGLSHYITGLQNGLQQKGHDVDVQSPSQLPEEEFTARITHNKKAIETYLIDRYGEAIPKIVKNASFIQTYQTFLEEKNLQKYDIIHAQDLFSIFILGKLNTHLQKPLFFTPHGLFTQSRLKFNKIKPNSVEETYFSEIEKQGLKAANKVILISNSFKNPLKIYDATEDKMIRVRTGIDFSINDVKRNPNQIVLSCIARLSPRKGHSYLIEALSLMKENLHDVKVNIVGEGTMRESLEKQAKQLNLENIHFLGKRFDIEDILATSDIYVLPTINDNFPISVLEAMFAKQAIITTNCGGIPEMIEHNRTGVICEPGNVEQLTEALELLIKDASFRKFLGTNAYHYANQYLTIEKMVEGIEGVYRKTVWDEKNGT
ncbi:glycosyltransferase family 4 protein [Pontibacillus yanchengensis]|uniref:Glycosyl transferase family 1 n=1 Tax=Pontibacillus yanchengensis Y32 TaxID=1385514 RepID=A0A0A2TBZ6_9BACI|nr:glycosyltransferase family 4 protein [Pontibacillus yanchengensis]KGP73332.1 glycosyl transferase family 1 [Pontibacillus yanchengensis Y32]